MYKSILCEITHNHSHWVFQERCFHVTEMTDNVTISCSYPPRGVKIILLVRMCCLLGLVPFIEYLSVCEIFFFCPNMSWIIRRFFCVYVHADWILLARVLSMWAKYLVKHNERYVTCSLIEYIDGFMGSIYRELMKDWVGIFRALFISVSNLPLAPPFSLFSVRTSLMKRRWKAKEN